MPPGGRRTRIGERTSSRGNRVNQEILRVDRWGLGTRSPKRSSETLRRGGAKAQPSAEIHGDKADSERLITWNAKRRISWVPGDKAGFSLLKKIELPIFVSIVTLLEISDSERTISSGPSFI